MAGIRIVVAFVFLLGACGGQTEPNEATPDDAVESMMRALDAGDCRAVKAVVVAPEQVDCGIVTEAAGSFADAGIDLDDVLYRAGSVVDDSATVRITWGNGDPTESYDVQRVEGMWLVVFDTAA